MDRFQQKVEVIRHEYETVDAARIFILYCLKYIHEKVKVFFSQENNLPIVTTMNDMVRRVLDTAAGMTCHKLI